MRCFRPCGVARGGDGGCGAAKTHGHFPLLVKFLDAEQDLSVQVHPDAAYAKGHPGAHLKSEAWYVLHAEPGAKIYKGLKPGVTREAFGEALETGEVAGLLNAIQGAGGGLPLFGRAGRCMRWGRVFWRPRCRRRAIRRFGCLTGIGWDRMGKRGRCTWRRRWRALILRRRMMRGGGEVGERGWGATIKHLVSCDYFSLERVRMDGEGGEGVGLKEPVVWIVLEGQGVINVTGHPPTAFARGDTLLLPAGMKGATVKTVTECAWLEVRLPAGRNKDAD